MTSSRGGLAGQLALAAAAATTTWLATFSWRGFTEEPARFVGPLLVLGVVVALTGALARWARLAAPLVVLIQLVLAGALASAMLSGSPIPVGPAWTELRDAFEGAMLTAEQYAAPVPATAAGVHPFFVVGGLGCLLLVDVLACTLRRVSLAGLPLLAIYSVPVSLLPGGVPWWVFAATAAGFLVMLFLRESEQVARWGRPLGTEPGDPSAFGVQTGAVRTTAAGVGASATALAVLLPLLIPTLDLSLLPGGRGPGDGDIEITNPMADLRRDLKRGEDVPLVQVRTDDPRPSYLRISVLNRFTNNEWSSGDRDVPTNQLASGQMPPLQGVSGTVARTTYEYDVTTTPSFESNWLPTHAPITRIDAEGDFRYDVQTMDFLAGRDDLTAAGLTYSMTGVDLQLSAESMARAPSTGGQVSNSFLDLPDGLPAAVSNYAYQVTRNDDTRFEKAVTLQEWFRRDGGFTYDLNTVEGNGTDDLLRFLTPGDGGRTGYCEQFASAMTVLARIVGIPSRVAIGFLQPDRIGEDTYEYSAWDLHAWPELFFPGSGWVRFEPTPPGRASGVPGYTTQPVAGIDTPSGPENRREADLLPNRGPSASPSASPAPEAAPQPDAEPSFSWLPVFGATGGLLLLVGLLLLPRLIRGSRSKRRRAGGPEAAWNELRDTTVDLGLSWPHDRSPRQTRERLVRQLGIPVDHATPERPAHGTAVAPEAVEALDRIVLTLERLRYARPGADVDRARLWADADTCLASLYGGSSGRARHRATWWPRSVLTRHPRRSTSVAAAPPSVRYGGVVDHVG